MDKESLIFQKNKIESLLMQYGGKENNKKEVLIRKNNIYIDCDTDEARSNPRFWQEMYLVLKKLPKDRELAIFSTSHIYKRTISPEENGFRNIFLERYITQIYHFPKSIWKLTKSSLYDKNDFSVMVICSNNKAEKGKESIKLIDMKELSYGEICYQFKEINEKKGHEYIMEFEKDFEYEWFESTFLDKYKNTLKRPERKLTKIEKISFEERIANAKERKNKNSMVFVMEEWYYKPIKTCFDKTISKDKVEKLLEDLELTESNHEILYKDVVLKIQSYLKIDEEREKAYKGILSLSNCICRDNPPTIQKIANETKTFQERIGRKQEYKTSLVTQCYSGKLKDCFDDFEKYMDNKYFQEIYITEFKQVESSLADSSLEQIIIFLNDKKDAVETVDLCVELLYRILVELFTVFDLEVENEKEKNRKEK